jgi:ABC transporter substrate binding protein
MRRREFITLLGGTAAAWPLAVRAQQLAMPVIGYLHPDSPHQMVRLLAAFHKGLSEAGYAEGRNVEFEYRWARNESDRLPELAADLVRRQCCGCGAGPWLSSSESPAVSVNSQPAFCPPSGAHSSRVAVIATPGSTAATLAAKAATSTIPIVFSIGGDPVQTGLVASLKRPGGNVTGVNSMNVELVAKRIGLLHELLPASARFAMLVNPKNATTESQTKDAQAAAAAIGRQIEILTASTDRDIDRAFATLVELRAGALVVGADNLFLS